MAEKRVQRRLAAILAADVVGYSRLIRADEEGTLARLKALQDELIDPSTVRHGGRIVKTMGDGVLIEFPSVVDAVRSAVEVQQRMTEHEADVPEDSRILFRVGVNLGDVVIDGNDIHGDGVNVAARLEGLADPGGICISGKVYEEVRDRVDFPFEDLGEKEVKNINRPVRVWRWVVDGLALAAGAGQDVSDAPLPLPDKPSIAVLPFDNMSGDSDQDYFSDGITEDIITELSRFHSMVVIARNSSFAFRGMATDVRDIGKKLGVHYVVEGSVRKSGKRVRVTVQLVDGATGHHIWAERYDRDLEDIFDMQDEITQAIVSTLPGRMEEAGRERAQRKRNPDLTAYDYLLLGLESFNRFSREDNLQAQQLSQMSIERDPLFARAHTLLAATYLWDLLLYAPGKGTLDKAFKSVEAALALDDEDSWSHAIFAVALFMRGQDEECEIHFQRAISLNSNDANAAAYFGSMLVYFGRWEEALDWSTKAKRLNPFPPPNYHWYHAIASYSAREYGQAISAVKQTRVLDRWHHGMLAMCYAQLGRMDEAGTEIALFSESPQRDVMVAGDPLPTDILDLVLERVNRYRIEADRDHFLDGLRKAGLPV
jgi:adenylate cyclase